MNKPILLTAFFSLCACIPLPTTIGVEDEDDDSKADEGDGHEGAAKPEADTNEDEDEGDEGDEPAADESYADEGDEADDEGADESDEGNPGSNEDLNEFECLLPGTPTVSVSMATVAGPSTEPNVFVVETVDEPCVIGGQGIVPGGSNGNAFFPGDFQVTVRESFSDDEASNETIRRTSETYVLEDGNDYVLVFPNDLSSEVMVIDDPNVLPGTYSVRYFNLQAEPVTIFGWDVLDRSAPPIVLAENVPPGGFTDRLIFELVPDPEGVGSVVPFVSSIDGTTPPFEDELDDDDEESDFTVRCGTGGGLHQTAFVYDSTTFVGYIFSRSRCVGAIDESTSEDEG